MVWCSFIEKEQQIYTSPTFGIEVYTEKYLQKKKKRQERVLLYFLAPQLLSTIGRRLEKENLIEKIFWMTHLRKFFCFSLSLSHFSSYWSCFAFTISTISVVAVCLFFFSFFFASSEGKEESE